MKIKPTNFLLPLLPTAVLILALAFPTPPPPAAIEPFLNGVFPKSSPNSDWELEEAMPGHEFTAPLRLLPFPDSSDLALLCKVGEVWRISLENQTRELILDIKDRTFKKGEAGTVGMAFHPQFGNANALDKQLLFVFYRTKPEVDVWSELGFNRLSKFRWDAVAQKFDPDSEEILLQQYDRMTWHNGGGMFFDEEGLLYLSVGDEGDKDHIAASTQRLNGGLFSGVLRLDVDKNPSRSHPIRRQPQPNEAPPTGWEDTYSQGYFIPNDNPWQSPDSSHLEEFFAIGVRSPFSMYYDRTEQQIWLADVGSSKAEEINLVKKGDNLQWPFLEGSIDSEDFGRPADLIGNERQFYAEYDRNTIGSCIIGGEIYRGTLFPKLNGRYLFADWMTDKLMALSSTSSNETPEIEILIGNIGSQADIVPSNPGIAGIFPQADGQILLTVMGQEVQAPGKIFYLKQKAEVPEPPARLSELGVFTDLATLETAPGIIPYSVNSPLWSDRAIKKRWMAIPNDGVFDSENEQVKFARSGEWEFPVGTVFIKHFDLPLTNDPSGEKARLETRFFIIGKDRQGYGLTYRWNDEGTEAYLQGGGSSREFDIYENGSFAFRQTWNFPSRDQCVTCHTPNAGYVLGVKTHQLNGDHYYAAVGRSMNQLAYLDQYHVFDRKIGDVPKMLAASHIADGSADLENRIRSYLDANCASCHRPNGVNDLTMDFRYEVPMNLKNIIQSPTKSNSSNQGLMIVEPGSHLNSEIWIRDASSEQNRMPPLGHNLIDEVYIAALVEWIGNLPADAGLFSEPLLFPNPTRGLLNVRANDGWQPPFHISINDLAGRLLYEEITSSRMVQVDFSGHVAGGYVLTISSGKERETKQFVVY